MKKIRFCLIAATMLMAFTPALRANLYQYTFNSGLQNGGVIPDGNLSGWSDVRSLSLIPDNQITDVQVTLNISGGYNGDLYGYLVHGSGFAVLLNRVGVGQVTSGSSAFGYGDTGFAVTLSSAAANNIHFYQNNSPSINGNGQLTGTWQADGRNISPLSSAATFDSPTPSATLANFNGLDPNGSWTLYFADVSVGEQSTLTGWSLDITAVPEPVNVALGIFGGLFVLFQLCRLPQIKRLMQKSA